MVDWLLKGNEVYFNLCRSNWSESSKKHLPRSAPCHNCTATMPNIAKIKKQIASTFHSIGSVSNNNVTRIRIPGLARKNFSPFAYAYHCKTQFNAQTALTNVSWRAQTSCRTEKTKHAMLTLWHLDVFATESYNRHAVNSSGSTNVTIKAFCFHWGKKFSILYSRRSITIRKLVTTLSSLVLTKG